MISYIYLTSHPCTKESFRPDDEKAHICRRDALARCISDLAPLSRSEVCSILELFYTPSLSLSFAWTELLPSRFISQLGDHILHATTSRFYLMTRRVATMRSMHRLMCVIPLWSALRGVAHFVLFFPSRISSNLKTHSSINFFRKQNCQNSAMSIRAWTFKDMERSLQGSWKNAGK